MRYSIVFCMRGRYYEKTKKCWSFRKCRYYVEHLNSRIMRMPKILIFDNVKNTVRWEGEYEWK